MIRDEVIAHLYNERRPEFERHTRCDSEFGPEILYSGKLIGSRCVTCRQVNNPKTENPGCLRVYDFEDGRALALGIEGFGEEYAIHCLLIHPDGRDEYANGYFLISPER